MTVDFKSRFVLYIALCLFASPIQAQGQVASTPGTGSSPSGEMPSQAASAGNAGPTNGGTVTPGLYQNSALNSLPPNEVVSNGIVSSKYILGPGDMLSVIVTPQSKYSMTQAPIEQDGSLDIPLVGTVNAAGMTIGELRDELAADLSKFCVNPDVTVQMVALRPQVVYITGGIKNPQILDVRAAPNVAKAITLAGGPIDNNELAHVTVFRGGQALPANVYGMLVNGIDTGDNVELQAGDLIVVPMNTAQFAVVGAVNAPGVYPLTVPGGNEGPMHLADALAAAGGIVRAGASVHNVQIVHRYPDGTTKSVTYDYGRFEKTGQIADNPVLTDKDLIFVPESRQTVGGAAAIGSLSVLALLKSL